MLLGSSGAAKLEQEFPSKKNSRSFRAIIERKEKTRNKEQRRQEKSHVRGCVHVFLVVTVKVKSICNKVSYSRNPLFGVNELNEV